MIADSPQAATDPGNINIVDKMDHAYEHAGDTMNNPAEVADPDYLVDPEAEELFGEGANLHRPHRSPRA